MDDEATRLAIAESLKTKCQFCSAIFKNHDELQLHQVSSCPSIENSSNTCTINEGNEGITSAADRSQGQGPNMSKNDGKLCANMDERQSHQAFECQETEGNQEKTTETTEPQNSPRPTSEVHNNLVLASHARNVEYSDDTNQRGKETIFTNYKINKVTAVKKKLDACSREAISVKEHSRSVVITMNTGAFEFFRKALITHLGKCEHYVVKPTDVRDGRNDVAQDIVRVYDKDATSRDPTADPAFTINLYRTKSRAMVNGPSYKAFISNDLQHLQNQMWKFSGSIDEANKNMNKAIIQYIADNKHQHTNMEKLNKTNTKSIPASNPARDNCKLTEVGKSGVNTGIEEDPITREMERKDNIEEEEEEEQQSHKRKRKRKTFDDYVLTEIARPDTASQKEQAPTEKLSMKAKTCNRKTYDTRSQILTSKEKATTGEPCTPPSENDDNKKLKDATQYNTACERSDNADATSHSTTEPETHTEADENIASECPKCNKAVSQEEDGVICEVCKAYWHYKCAETNEDEINQLRDKGFLCAEHREQNNGQNGLQEIEDTNIVNLKKPTKNAEAKLTKQAKEVEELRKELKKLTDTHAKELDKRQTSLESLLSQNKKMKRENEQHLIKADVKEKEIENLVKENKRLSMENAAHHEFIKTALQDENITEANDRLKAENIKLAESLEEKARQLSELSREGSQDETKKKLSEAKKTIESLKVRIKAFETSVNELQETNSGLKSELQIKTASYEREVELNNILIKQASKPANAETQQDSHRQQEEDQPMSQTTTTGQNDPSEGHDSSNQKDGKGICCYEFEKKDSCTFKDRCKFSHAIGEETRKNKDIQQKMKRVRDNKTNNQRTNKLCVTEYFRQGMCNYSRNGKECMFSHNITNDMRNDEVTNQRMTNLWQKLNRSPIPQQICPTVFRDGPNSCSPECEKKHNLDFQKINRGICHLFVLGTCRRKDKCNFTHEIPKTVLEDEVIQQKAKKFKDGHNRMKPVRNAENEEQREVSNEDANMTRRNATLENDATGQRASQYSAGRRRTHSIEDANNITNVTKYETNNYPIDITHSPFTTGSSERRDRVGINCQPRTQDSITNKIQAVNIPHNQSSFLWDTRRTIQEQHPITPIPQPMNSNYLQQQMEQYPPINPYNIQTYQNYNQQQYMPQFVTNQPQL